MLKSHRGDNPSPSVRPPRRTHYPNLSPTRPPAIAKDAKLWPAWTGVPLDRIGLVLLDEHGLPVAVGGGGA